MILNEFYKLNNGYSVPKIAFGTWQIPNEEVTAAAGAALSIGYRHIDTALAYENEEGIGNALKESGLKREEVFLTSKIPADIKTYDGAKAAIETSLKNLKTEYIDLMLIHSPKPWPELFSGSQKTYFEENLAVWRAMEEATFSPNATGKLLGHPVITRIADKYHVSVPQLSIRFCLQLRLLPLPRSTNPSHIAENTKLAFEISESDMNTLKQVEEIRSLD